MKLLYFIPFLLFSCKSINCDRIEFKDNLAFDSKKDKLFSGKSICINEENNISSLKHYRKGKPHGKFFVYGHQNEIIQEGYWLKNQSIKEKIQRTINCSRVDIKLWKEGNSNFVDVYLYGNNIELIRKEVLENYLPIHLLIEKEQKSTIRYYMKHNDKCVYIENH